MALAEFEEALQALQNAGIKCLVLEDNLEPPKPDAIFPNNWFSTHANGSLCLYPMRTENRRNEIRTELIKTIQKEHEIKRLFDLRPYAEENTFLEGTGSMVFDHQHRIAYACLSPRTNEKLFNTHCESLGYSPISFEALDAKKQAIYHTNVLMSIGTDFFLVCLEAIKSEAVKARIKAHCKAQQKQLIEISLAQMNQFAANLLEVQNQQGEKMVVLSKTAHESLSEHQIQALSAKAKLVVVSIPTIEKIGGGGIRCMMAEIFLSPKF